MQRKNWDYQFESKKNEKKNAREKKQIKQNANN